MTIPLSLMGQTAVWVLGFVLMGVGTWGDEEVARDWAIMCAAVAAVWTINYLLGWHRTTLQRTFELGLAAGERSSVRPVP